MLSQQLDGSLEIVQALNSVKSEHVSLLQRWDQAPKQILAADEPSFTLYYLNWLLTNYDVLLDFDFTLNKMTTDGDILKFSFTLAGEGPYHDIYRLIRFITKNPILYQIESIFIQNKNEDSNFLSFQMQIHGFSLTKEWEAEREFSFASIKPITENLLFHDAFKPLRKNRKSQNNGNMFQQKITRKAPSNQKKSDCIFCKWRSD